ncbi:MAG: protein kinase domain-containing protein, partial [Planctomycetota bacterium]
MAEESTPSSSGDTVRGPDPEVCPACRAELEPGITLCPRCGNLMDSDAATLAPTGDLSTPLPDEVQRAPTRGELEASLPDIAGPGSIDRYEDLGEFDKGGMGAIHEVLDLDLNRPVAKKILREGQAGRAARFVEEAKVTGQLEHPNIVPVHELGFDEEKQVYFTMKLVKGEALDQILDDLKAGRSRAVHAFPLARLLEIFLKVCEATAYAHSRGVIHRDLKPENVMVGEFGEVLVMDWGLAKVRGRSEEPADGSVSSIRGDPGFRGTVVGGIVGTPAYMAPEQAMARHDDVDERSDIWALGGLLYSVLCREAPYDGATYTVIIAKAAERDLEPPRKRAPQVPIPPELEAICMKAMAPEKKDRYRSVQALMDDLRAFQDRRLVGAYRYGIRERLTRWVQRHPTASVSGSIASILLVGAAALTAVLVQQTEIADMRAREAAQRADRQKARADVAEDRRDLAERTLEKGRKVSKVLRAADRNLGKVLEELKRSYYSSSSASRKREVGQKLWPRVEAFFSRIDKDPASQAAALASKGWLRRLAGFENEAMTLFEASRKADPDVATGWLFEGMVWLSKYLAVQSLPQARMGSAGLSFEDVPPETDQMTRLRGRFEAMVDAVRETPVWGESAAKEFQEVLSGFRGIQRKDWEAVEKGLSTALAVPEMIWMKEAVLLARAKARYLRKDIRGGIRDAKEVVEALPESGSGHKFLGLLLVARGLLRMARGEEAETDFLDAVRSFTTTLDLNPRSYHTINSRAIANFHLAKYLQERSRDPRGAFQEAIRDFTHTLEQRPDYYVVRNNRGSAFLYFGKAGAEGLTDRGGAYKAAIADFSAVIERNPRFQLAYNNRGTAYQAVGNLAAAEGRDPLPAWEKSLADFGASLKLKEACPESYNNQGLTYQMMGNFERDRGRSPMGAYERSVSDFSRALKITGPNAMFFNNRGNSYTSMGRWEMDHGRDPRAFFTKSRDDFEAAIDLHPRHFISYNNLGLLFTHLGKYEARIGEDAEGRFHGAIERLGKALEICPEYLAARSNMALAYLRLAKFVQGHGRDPRDALKKSIASSKDVLEQRKNFLNALRHLAAAALAMGLFERTKGRDPGAYLREAIESYNTILERAPRDYSSRSNRGSARLEMAQWEAGRGGNPKPWCEKAIADCTETLRYNPKMVQAYHNRGT